MAEAADKVIGSASNFIPDNAESAEALLHQQLERFRQELSDHGSFSGILVTLLDRDSNHLICAYSKVPDHHAALDDTLKNYRIPLDLEHPMCTAYSTKSRVELSPEAIDNLPESVRIRVRLWGCDSMLFVPIVDRGDNCFGVILLMRDDGVFSPQEVCDLDGYIRSSAGQLYHRYRYLKLEAKEQELNRQLSEQEAFLSFTTQLMDLSSVEEIKTAVTREFLRRYPFDFAAVFLKKNDRLISERVEVCPKTLSERKEVVTDFFGSLDVEISSEQGAIAVCCEQNTLFFVPDGEMLRDYPMVDNDQKAYEVLGSLRTIAHIPLRYKQEAIGVLTLVCTHQIIELSSVEKSILEHVGEFVGNAIRHAELYEEVMKQKGEIESLNCQLQQKVETLGDIAIRDPLTSLYNFRYFREQLSLREEECHRDPDKQNLSLILLDIDHFKKVNDTYGHQAGNEVLQVVGRCLMDQTRRIDVVCRFGGEEFAAILPACSLDKAFECAERIRNALADLKINVGDQLISITVSLGVAELSPGMTSDELIEWADKALYQAKSEGRNRSIGV